VEELAVVVTGAVGAVEVVVEVVGDGVTTTPKSKVKSASPLLGRFTDVAVSVDESTARSEPAPAVVA
jgi:hypothetical protein